MSQMIYSKEMLNQDWNSLTPDVKSLLIDIATKIELVRKIDDGYGKIIITMQRGEIRQISTVQEKLVISVE